MIIRYYCVKTIIMPTINKNYNTNFLNTLWVMTVFSLILSYGIISNDCTIQLYVEFIDTFLGEQEKIEFKS